MSHLSLLYVAKDGQTYHNSATLVSRKLVHIWNPQYLPFLSVYFSSKYSNVIIKNWVQN
jgi:hypothetical protein